MVSLGTRLHQDCNAMGDAAKISPRIPFTCAQHAILSLLIVRDCKAMGDAGNISHRVPFTCAQNGILSLLIIHFIPRRQIYVAIDDPSFVPSVSCLSTSSYLGMTCTQPIIFPTMKTCKATAACACLTCSNFETGFMLPQFSGIVVTSRANQYWTKAPSSFRSLILNSHCTCHRRRLFIAP